MGVSLLEDKPSVPPHILFSCQFQKLSIPGFVCVWKRNKSGMSLKVTGADLLLQAFHNPFRRMNCSGTPLEQNSSQKFSSMECSRNLFSNRKCSGISLELGRSSWGGFSLFSWTQVRRRRLEDKVLDFWSSSFRSFPESCLRGLGFLVACRRREFLCS